MGNNGQLPYLEKELSNDDTSGIDSKLIIQETNFNGSITT